ncbi:type VII secretion-associated serine protease mycosin [Nocardioides marinquilinus]|uniref:Type VII secretion-associated serine protease mycosin n=1 Tax=Nocardioides marinquilinus TaxID=1210400 RepID=A0ABP9PAC0_9ACTN
MMPWRRCGALAAASAVISLSAVVVVHPPAVAEDGDYDCRTLSKENREGEPPRGPSSPIADLDIAQAQDLVREMTARAPGAGVKVAVVDSGVSKAAPINRPATGAEVVLGSEFVGYRSGVRFYHGTAMAGVIAGQPVEAGGVGEVGIAPGAEIVDVHVYDLPSDTDEDTKDIGLTQAGLIAGLAAIEDQVGDGPNQVRIVNISLTGSAHDPALERAIRAITSKGAIVVTSAGNRYLSDDQTVEPFEPGEDLAGKFFPAAYAHDGPDWKANDRIVVAGSTIPPDLYDPDDPLVALSSDIDVVVPTADVVTFGQTGEPCRLYEPNTSIAAAEVSGILALLVAAFPDAGPDELIKRLEVTAAGETSGDPRSPERFQGKGVVQPVEALTRASIKGAPPGARRRPAVEPAIIPEPEPDLLAGTRGDAVWWGLAGGGALVVALILRPVLARRRRES